MTTEIAGRALWLGASDAVVDLWLAPLQRTSADTRRPLLAVIPTDVDRRTGLQGRLVSDAEIAALTLEYGGVLYNGGSGLHAVSGTAVENPLV